MIDCCYDSLYGSFVSRKFTDIYPSADTFIADREDLGLIIPEIVTEDDLRNIYYLLYAKYANSHISSSDETQFKYKLFGIIYSRGPTYVKRLAIQDRLRNMEDEELISGAMQINNHSFNPSTAPSTDSDLILETINEQNTLKYKKSILDGYTWLTNMLKTDLTSDFINQFKPLFLSVVAPQGELWYVTDKEDIDND